ncbi:hypothetical protein [Lapidilactobacillus gannanensis]|uniref:AbrB family transcriptional regulator n=1 Tax=Lapidilactobacillus gannanensis TaxID=2486002 RepID=A0ABW4BKN2_9LACO|nr:hypothetical protein [Lapidilactobacillus gannanensis]
MKVKTRFAAFVPNSKHIKLPKKVGDELDLYYPEATIIFVIKDIMQGTVSEEIRSYYRDYGDAGIERLKYAMRDGWEPIDISDDDLPF